MLLRGVNPKGDGFPKKVLSSCGVNIIDIKFKKHLNLKSISFVAIKICSRVLVPLWRKGTQIRKARNRFSLSNG